MSEAGTPANSLKRRKVATPSLSLVPGKETVSVADGNKQHSSLRRQSVPRDYVSVSAQKHIPNITRNASLWDPDTVEARKVAVNLAEALITPEAQTRFDQAKDLAEMTETSVLHTIRAAALSRTIYNKYLQEAAESREKISMLNQDLEEAKTEVKLEKISQEMAKNLVEQAKQEKKVVELKFTSEKACLKRKIQELEMELQQQKDQFKDALVDAEVDGYNKCVKKAREMGLKYENLLLDHVNGPMRQEEYIVHSATSNSGNSNAYTDMGNATDPTAAIPTDMFASVPSFVKKFVKYKDMFKDEDELMLETSINITPLPTALVPPATQEPSDISGKQKLSSNSQGTTSTMKLRSGKSYCHVVATTPSLDMQAFTRMLEEQISDKSMASWSRMKIAEASQAMLTSAAQNTFFQLRFVEQLAAAARGDQKLKEELKKLRTKLKTANDERKKLVEANRKLKASETTLTKEKGQLVSTIKEQNDDKIKIEAAHAEQVKDLELQMEGLQKVVDTFKSLRSTREKAGYEVGYANGIKDYVRSMYEKVPNFDWSILGEDALAMVEELKKKLPVAEEEKAGSQDATLTTEVQMNLDVVPYAGDVKVPVLAPGEVYVLGPVTAEPTQKTSISGSTPRDP